MNDGFYVPFIGKYVVVNYEQIENEGGEYLDNKFISKLKAGSIADAYELQRLTYDAVPERIFPKEQFYAYCLASIQQKGSMSLEARSVDGKLEGFCLTLNGDSEATRKKLYVDPLKRFTGQTECLYVSEWIGNKRAGGYLIRAFFQKYSIDFLANGLLTPIVGDHRISTSFGTIQEGHDTIEKIINRVSDNEKKWTLNRYESKIKKRGDYYKSVILVPCEIEFSHLAYSNQ